jgi:hypothetical protein
MHEFLKGRIAERSDGSIWFYRDVGGPALPIDKYFLRKFKDRRITIEIKEIR